MEMEIGIRNIIEKPSIFCNIVPYIGYYDQVYYMFQRISMKTRTEFKSLEKVLRDNIMKLNFRIHPHFTEDIDYPMKDIKNIYKDSLYKLFVYPGVDVTSIESEQEFNRIISSNYIGRNTNKNSDLYRSISSLESILFRTNLQCWQLNKDLPQLNSIDTFDYSNYNGNLEYNDIISCLNKLACPINNINCTIRDNFNIPEEELNEIASNSVKTFKLRAEYSPNIKLLDIKRKIIELFPYLKSIILETNTPNLEFWCDSFIGEPHNIIDEYSLNGYSSDPKDGFYLTLKSKNAVCYQAEENIAPLCVKLGYCSVNSKKMIQIIKVTCSKDLEQTNQAMEKYFFCCNISGIKVFRDLQKLSPKEQTESVIVQSELALFKNSFLFPVENVTECNIEVITAENKECVHQIYDFLCCIRHTQISLKITDKTLKEELEKIIPTLSEFKFNSFELDLYYSSRSVFSAIIDFLERYKHKSLNSFTIKIYSMREFDSLMQFFTKTVIHFKRIKLQLFTEVIVG